MPAKIFDTSFLPDPQDMAFPPEREMPITTWECASSIAVTVSLMLQPHDQAVVPTRNSTVVRFVSGF